MKTNPSQISPGLYIVPTPIGNLRDITLRALDVLQQADLIACEDTRVTAKLLSHYGIRKPTLSYNDHNGEARRPQILSALKEGKSVALVSDAGTPLVSDPGYKLVRAAVEEGIYTTALPGASSVLTALCLSALPTDRFFFAGFLPAKKEACKKEIEELSVIPSTLVLFESAKRLPDTLKTLAAAWPGRAAAVVREITKKFEEARRGALSDLESYYNEHGAPKGEVVIVIAPPDKAMATLDDIKAGLRTLLETHSVKEAATFLAHKTGRPRKDIYALALTLRDHG